MTRRQNAADEEQVKVAGDKQKSAYDREILDLKTVLELPEGRRFIQVVLGLCGITSSIWDQNASLHSYRSGAQDVGHLIVERALEANPSLAVVMLADAYRKTKGDLNE